LVAQLELSPLPGPQLVERQNLDPLDTAQRSGKGGHCIDILRCVGEAWYEQVAYPRLVASIRIWK